MREPPGHAFTGPPTPLSCVGVPHLNAGNGKRYMPGVGPSSPGPLSGEMSTYPVGDLVGSESASALRWTRPPL